MGYRKVTLYFYTGTGNSFRVANWIADATRDAGASVTVCPTHSAHPAEEVGRGAEALLGLVMPTHGFTAPWAVIHFALRLPRREETHAVIVATRGGLKIGPLYTPGFEGTALFVVALILALKGYRIRGTAGIDMPSNWMVLHPGLPPDAVAGIAGRARVAVDRLATTVLSGRRYLRGWVFFVIGLLILPVSLGYLLIGRFFLARLFFASGRCTGCGHCAAHCPNGAIRMLGRRPYWTFRCQSCMRCMAFCPAQAVEASHLLGVVAYLTGAIPATALATWLATHVPALAFLSEIAGRALLWVGVMVALGALYPLFHAALRVGWVRRFLRLRRRRTTIDGTTSQRQGLKSWSRE